MTRMIGTHLWYKTLVHRSMPCSMERPPFPSLFPQSAPECLGELLESRFMLPFHLPTDNSYLVATPPAEAAFVHVFPPGTWALDGTKSSRPPSRSSFASARPMGWAIPSARKIRELPQDFLTWLKERETYRRHKRESLKHITELEPAVDNPLNPSQRRINLPPKASDDTRTLRIKPSLPSLQEGDMVTPIATSISYPASFPSAGLKTSPSIDQLREKAQIPFHPSSLQHVRSESFELKDRSPVRQHPTKLTMPPRSPSIPILSPQAEFSSPRTNNATSSAMSPAPSSESKKWWKLGKKQGSAGSEADERSSGGGNGKRRNSREESEDTLGYGMGLEKMRTPGATTPGSGSSKGSHFWAK